MNLLLGRREGKLGEQFPYSYFGPYERREIGDHLKILKKWIKHFLEWVRVEGRGVVFCEALSCVWPFGVIYTPCMLLCAPLLDVVNIIDLCLSKKKKKSPRVLLSAIL